MTNNIVQATNQRAKDRVAINTVYKSNCCHSSCLSLHVTVQPCCSSSSDEMFKEGRGGGHPCYWFYLPLFMPGQKYTVFTTCLWLPKMPMPGDDMSRAQWMYVCMAVSYSDPILRNSEWWYDTTHICASSYKKVEIHPRRIYARGVAVGSKCLLLKSK